jgi:hypothetical protein
MPASKFAMLFRTPAPSRSHDITAHMSSPLWISESSAPNTFNTLKSFWIEKRIGISNATSRLRDVDDLASG